MGSPSPRTRYVEDPVVDRSLHHSMRDAAAYSVMTGGGETYFSAFAIFLKASITQVALLGVFLISGLLRLLCALVFIPHLREVREVPPMSTSGLIFRVSGFHALAGLIFDMLLPKSRKRGANENIRE